MRLHRFFLGQTISAEGVNHSSDSTLIHQLSHVFRLHKGDKAIFFNGTGLDHECEIVSLDKSEMVFRAIKTTTVKQFYKINVSLVVSLIKKDNLEWIIQKGTELGVSEFIPVISERSEKKGFNKERATKIMIEAVEQSGRSNVPTIHELQSLEDFLDKEQRKIISFHVTGESFTKKCVPESGEVVICVGPEGGWSDAEIELFIKKGARILKLDTPVLRAETAAIALSTLFLVP